MNRGLLHRLTALPVLFGISFLFSCTVRPNPGTGRDMASFIRDNYEKEEVRVPVRDGVHLFTAIYAPKDRSRSYPILMRRTPYSVAPYGEGSFPGTLGPSETLTREGFIFVLQDVRGAYMSEGDFLNMTPHRPVKSGPEDVDESTDAYDTIEWLLANVENHNGRVGMWGISYPGFYAAASMIDAHPALRAVSPQAPIADWWYDDFHHHGAFFLPHAFNFLSSFGVPRPEPTTRGNPPFNHGTPDGYSFFLEMGPLSNANELYLKHGIPFWDSIIAHPNYDGFWQPRNLLPHLANVAPAVLTVGGWYDAEDLYGALNIYRSVEEQNPGVFNALVMGPWRHGGWARDDGSYLGNAYFGSETAVYYRENIEAPFFRHFLKDEGPMTLPEAYVFETGTDQWRTFSDWPPEGTNEAFLYPGPKGSLAFSPGGTGGAPFDEWVSDPSKPVPYTSDVAIGMTREYMTDDQRFAARRPDVVTYQTDVLREDVTLVGPVVAELWVSTTGTDSDWIVKLVDVYPPNAEDPPQEAFSRGMHAGEAQMMVRSEVIRGRFRNAKEVPEPFVPGQPTRVELPLQDVLHTFQAGHRIMIQVQSTWFPLVDRNPQSYVENIYLADAEDFVPATQRLYRSNEFPSRVRVGILSGRGGE
jgi:putative CocE/NonD family hydrolase